MNEYEPMWNENGLATKKRLRLSFWLQTAGFVVAKLVLDLCFFGVFMLWWGESMGDRANHRLMSLYSTLLWVIVGLQAVPCLCGLAAAILLRHTVRLSGPANWTLGLIVAYLGMSVLEVLLRDIALVLVFVTAAIWLAQVSVFYTVYRQAYEHVDGHCDDEPPSAAQVGDQLKISLYWHLFGYVICHAVFGAIFFYVLLSFAGPFWLYSLLGLLLVTLGCGGCGAVLMLLLVKPLHQHCMTQLAVAQLAIICAHAVVSVVIVAVVDPLVALMFYVTPTLWIAQVVCYYVLVHMVRSHLQQPDGVRSVELASLA